MKTWFTIFTLLLLTVGVRGGAGEIKIGVVLPLTGSTSNYGTEALRGMNLAVEEINLAGGIKGQSLTLVVKDNGGDPTRTSNEMSALVGDEAVISIVGPVTSTNSAAAAAVAQQNKTPLVMPYATSPYVTEIGEYVLRICFTDPFQSKALAEFSRQHLKSEKVAIIFEQGSSYSEKLAEFFALRFKDMGGRIVYEQSFQSGSTEELKGLVEAAMKEKPDLLFAPMYYPEAAKVVSHLASAGSSVAVLGSDGWESSEFFNLTEGYSGEVYISSHFSLQYQVRRGSEFVGHFQRTYDDPPNAVSALGYDAIGTLADGLRRATALSREGVLQALVTTTDYQGVTGRISINEKRNVIKDVFILKALEDVFVYETIISNF